MELLRVNIQIEAYLKTEPKYRAVKVFVLFNSEAAQREVLNEMCLGRIPAFFNISDDVPDWLMMKGQDGAENLLHIDIAPGPSSVIYENLERTTLDHVIEQIVSNFLLGLALIVCFYTIDEAFKGGEPVLGAILISGGLGLLLRVSQVLTVLPVQSGTPFSPSLSRCW